MSNDIVPFNKNDVMIYLDSCIEYWRKEKKSFEENMDDGFWSMERNKIIAVCYIDAYQSVRVSLFGELLPKGDEG